MMDVVISPEILRILDALYNGGRPANPLPSPGILEGLAAKTNYMNQTSPAQRRLASPMTQLSTGVQR